MSTFIEWLISDAGAGWIIGALGTCGAIYTWYHRDIPANVIIQEISVTRLLDIQQSHQESISVFYNDGKEQKQIKSLEQKTIVVYNNGTIDINDPLKLVIRFYDEKNKIPFNGFCKLSIENSHCVYSSINDDKGNIIGVSIDIPHLNSYKLHKSLITIYFISDGPAHLRLEDGEGRGWSSSMVSFPKIRKLRNYSKAIIVVLMSLSFFAIILITNRIFDAIKSSINSSYYDLLSQQNIIIMVTSVVFLTIFIILLDSLSKNIIELVSSKYFNIQSFSKFDSKKVDSQ